MSLPVEQLVSNLFRPLSKEQFVQLIRVKRVLKYPTHHIHLKNSERYRRLDEVFEKLNISSNNKFIQIIWDQVNWVVQKNDLVNRSIPNTNNSSIRQTPRLPFEKNCSHKSPFWGMFSKICRLLQKSFVNTLRTAPVKKNWINYFFELTVSLSYFRIFENC